MTYMNGVVYLQAGQYDASTKKQGTDDNSRRRYRL